MKALAEFAMRGRFQALLLVVAGSGSILFCWISAAVLALITLRKGVGAGAQLLLWALLPAGVLLYTTGDSGPLALLLGTGVLAGVLRTTVSLPTAVLATGLMLSALISFACGLLLDNVTRGRQELRRLSYLSIPGVSSKN